MDVILVLVVGPPPPPKKKRERKKKETKLPPILPPPPLVSTTTGGCKVRAFNLKQKRKEQNRPLPSIRLITIDSSSSSGSSSGSSIWEFVNRVMMMSQEVGEKVVSLI